VKPLDYHAGAEADLDEGIAYYENQKSGLGLEFQAEVEESTSQIQRSPKAFSPYGTEGLRKRVLDRFPYTIFYLEMDDRIWIAAVANQRRRPDYWAGRLP
jgi:toxin ParE1/3/4